MPSPDSTVNRLVLGTVQLGFPYGIANRTGQPDTATAEAIVRTAWDGNIIEFDTAPTYGASERILGNILQGLGATENARITSKLHLAMDQPLPASLEPLVNSSLQRLKVSKLHCLMMHSEEMLEAWRIGIGELLIDCRQSGLIEHIGVSVYTPQKAIEALETKEVTAIQIPANILDHRFEKCGVFDLAAQASKQIYIRSIFLQGLLLMDTRELSSTMGFAVKTLEQVDQLARQADLSRLDLAMGYIKQAYPEAQIVFGAETAQQVHRNLSVWEKPFPSGVLTQARRLFQDTPEIILNPSFWPL